MSQEILRNIIFEFNPAKFKRFFRSLNTLFIPRSEEILIDTNERFKSGELVGEIPYESEAANLIVCTVKTDQTLSERSGKKAQYDYAKKYLTLTQKEAGIFIFYDQYGNFRFSLVYPQFVGTRKNWSNFRRFTYLVGAESTNKTFLSRIGNGDFSSLVKVKEAFSVEPVTYRFFDEFRLYFEKTKADFEETNKNTVCLWLKDKYSPEEYHEQINRFTFLLMGRIIFIYFLQRKCLVLN